MISNRLDELDCKVFGMRKRAMGHYGTLTFKLAASTGYLRLIQMIKLRQFQAW